LVIGFSFVTLLLMLLFPFLLGFDYPQSQLVSSRSTGMFNCTHNALACSSINGAEGL
jgi:hypothetical protein